MTTPSTAPPPGTTNAPAKPRRKWWRRILRGGAFLFLALLLLVAAIPLIVSSSVVRGIAEKKATATLQRPVTIQEIDLSWSGKFELRGLSIAPLPAEPQQPTIAIGLLRARWGWKPLFSSKVRIDEARIEGVRVTVARAADGSLNLLNLVPKSTTPPPPPPPPKPAAPPGPPLTELPLLALFAYANDIEIDYIDDALTPPVRAKYRIDKSGIELPSPTSPLVMSLASALTGAQGDRSWNIPVTSSLTVTPGPGGYLQWKGLTAEGRGALGEEILATLDIGPRPAAAGHGIDAKATWRLDIPGLMRHAERGLGKPLPARAAGRIDGNLVAAFDLKDSATIALTTQWHDLVVRGDALATGTLNLGSPRFDFAAATLPPASATTSPEKPFSRLRILRCDASAPIAAFGMKGDLSGLGTTTGPELDLALRFDQDPDALDHLLRDLNRPLPPKAALYRGMQWRGSVRGPALSALGVDGRLAVALRPLHSAAAPTTPQALTDRTLSLLHSTLYRHGNGDVTTRVVLSDANPDSYSRAPAIPAWVQVDVNAEAVRNPNRSGHVKIAFTPERALAFATALGFAPEGYQTTGTLTTSIAFRTAAAGDVETSVTFGGAMGAGLRRELLARVAPAVRPLQTTTIAIPATSDSRLLFKRNAAGDMRLESSGDIEIHTGWRAEAPTTETLAAAAKSAAAKAKSTGRPASAPLPPPRLTARIPVSWNLSFAWPKGKPFDLKLRTDSTPFLDIEAPMPLANREKLVATLDLSFDPATGDADLREFRATAGNWAVAESDVRVKSLGKHAIEGRFATTVRYDDGILAWIPAALKKAFGVLDFRGSSGLLTTFRGKWNPADPGEGLALDLRATHTFDSIQIGRAPFLLARGRGWRGELAMPMRLAPGGAPPQLGAIRATWDMDRLSSLLQFAIHDVKTSATATFSMAPPRTATWDVEGSVGRIIAAKPPVPVILNSLSYSTSGAFDVMTKDVRDARFAAELPGQVRVESACDFTSKTQEYAFRGKMVFPALAWMVQMPIAADAELTDTPTEGVIWQGGVRAASMITMLKRLPLFEGRAEMGIDVTGTVPTPRQTARLEIPIDLKTYATLDDLDTTIKRPLLVRLNDFRQRSDFAMRNQQMQFAHEARLGTLRVELPRVAHLKPGETPPPGDLLIRNSTWDGRAAIDLAAGRFEFTGGTFAFPEYAVRGGGSMSIGGWRPVLDAFIAAREQTAAAAAAAKANPDSDAAQTNAPPASFMPEGGPMALARALTLDTTSELYWESPEWKTLPAPGNPQMRGTVGGYFTASQEPGREVKVVTGMRAEGWEFRRGEQLRVGPVRGALEFLVSGRRRTAEPAINTFLSDRLFARPGSELARAGWSGDLQARVLAPPRPDQDTAMRIDEIVFGPWKIGDLVLRSSGDIRRWQVAFESSKFVGGSARGTMGLEQADEAGNEWILHMEGEFTGISAREAIPTWRTLDPAETEVSGIFDMRWRIRRDSTDAADVLRDLEVRMLVTRVGPRALQGFLLAMDPEEKNPQFVAARAGLAFGRPDYFSFTLRQGLMDMAAGLTTFTGAGMRMPILQRAPAAELFRLDALRPKLNALQGLPAALARLDALDEWASALPDPPIETRPRPAAVAPAKSN